MKAGFTVSIAAHIIALAILLVSFSAPPLPENQQTEEVPITLAPMSDVLALQKGEADAAKKQKAAQKPTQKPEVKPDAQNAGNAKIDTPLPEKPNLKERQVNAPPPPKGEEQGKTEPARPEEPKPAAQPKAETPPKPAEEKPAPKQPEPAPAAPQSPNAPSDDIGDLLKADAPEKKPEPVKPEQPQPKPEAPKAEEKPQPPAEPAIPDLAAAQVPLPVIRPAEPKPEAKKGEKDGAGAADSRNALIDRTKTSGGGAKRSQDEAAFGASKNIGDNAELQQTLNNIIGSCVARNWDIGVIQGSNAYDLRVQVHFRLNQDGSLAGTPEMTPAGGDAKDQEVISRQAQAALAKCAPFKLPADKYDQWHDVTINMRAFPN